MRQQPRPAAMIALPRRPQKPCENHEKMLCHGRACAAPTWSRYVDGLGALSGLPEIMLELGAHPRLVRAAERLFQPDRHLSRNASATVQKLGKRLPRHAEPLGGSRYGQAKRLKAR